METCGEVINRFDITGQNEYMTCLLPDKHSGPHLIKRHAGPYVLFEYEICEGQSYANCDGCQSENSNDHCVTYHFIDSEEVEKIIKSIRRGNRM